MTHFARKYTWTILLAVLFIAAGLFRLNDLSLYTDCTRYLIWGNSLAHGNGFVDDTQPVPERFVVNAPLYAAVLSPVLRLFPYSLTAAKIWTLILGGAALILYGIWITQRLKGSPVAWAVLLLALNPLTLILSTEVLSESTFLCALFAAFILLEEIDPERPAARLNVAFILLVSLVVLLREVGAALSGAAVIYFALQKRYRLAATILAATSAVYLLWMYRNIVLTASADSAMRSNLSFIFRHVVTSPDASMAAELIRRAEMNIQAYAADCTGIIVRFIPQNLIIHPFAVYRSIAASAAAVGTYSWVILLPAIVYGLVCDIRESRTAFFRIAFIILYLVIIFLYPLQDVRFLFPLLPLWIYYIILAGKHFSRRLNTRIPRSAAVLMAVPVLISFVHAATDFEILRTNVSYRADPLHSPAEQEGRILPASYFSTPWALLGEWIDRELPAGSIIATANKEIAPFASNQKFLELNRTLPLPMFESMLRNNSAEYLIATVSADSLTEYQTSIDESQRFRFQLLCSFRRLSLYRIDSPLNRSGLPASTERSLEADRVSLRTYMREGRNAFRREIYDEAFNAFSQLRTAAPFLPDGPYQCLIVSAFALDSAHALGALQALYAAPRSSSFIPSAQAYLSIMNLLVRGPSVNDPGRRARIYLDAGKRSWEYGCPVQARRIVGMSLEADPGFAEALIYAWHFALHTGDTAAAEKYLKRLGEVAPLNPTRTILQSIAAAMDKLNTPAGPRVRGEEYLTLSREYAKIGLFSEAVDDALRAIQADPLNPIPHGYLAGLFEQNNFPLAAARERRREAATNLASKSMNNGQPPE